MQTHQKYSPLLSAIGDELIDAKYLAAGARSKVWKIRGRKQAYVLRVFKAAAGAFSPGQDANLRELLLRDGACVAQPVLNSDQEGSPDLGRKWCLDVFAPGHRFAPEQATSAQLHKFGKALRVLHDVPLKAVGRASTLPSQAPGQVMDLLDALERAEPIGLLEQVADIRKRLEDSIAPDFSEVVLCNSDIHDQQVLLKGPDKLTWLDFSETRLAPRHWDLGAALLMAGPRLYGEIVAGYGGGAADHVSVEYSAKLQALAWAVSIRKKRAAQARAYLGEVSGG